MSIKTKIAAMTAQQFGEFTRAQSQSLAAFSSAALFAISQCCNDKDNTAPLNEIMRLPAVQFKSHKLLQFGDYLRQYFASILGHSVQWQADRGRFQFVKKSATVYVDIAECQRFAEFFADKGKAKQSASEEKPPQPVSASTLTKTLERVAANGMTAKTVETARELLAAIPALQTAALALVQAMEAKRDDNAATVTDGATGEYSRNEAHKPADEKAGIAKAVKPTGKRGSLGDKLNAALVQELRKVA